MRGTHFSSNVEYTIETEKESYRQGDELKVSLSLKNHGSTEAIVSPLVALSHATMTKVHKGDRSVFKEKLELEGSSDISLAAGASESIELNIVLDVDCPFTDKKNSYFILYGPKNEEEQLAFLQLNVEKQEILNEYISIIENFIRFKVKTQLWKKGAMELKCVPPGGRDFATLDGLTCLVNLDKDKNLNTKLTFKTKKLSYGGAEAAATDGVAVKAGNVIIEKTMGPKEYLIYGSSPNQDKIVQFFQDSLAKVKAKTMI